MDFNDLINNSTQDITPENIITIQLTKSKNKYISSINGLSYLSDNTNFLKNTMVYLKKKLCCGASLKNNNIELQGDHVESIKKYLMDDHNINIKQIIIKGK